MFFDHGSQLLLAIYGAAITFRKPNVPPGNDLTAIDKKKKKILDW